VINILNFPTKLFLCILTITAIYQC